MQTLCISFQNNTGSCTVTQYSFGKQCKYRNYLEDYNRRLYVIGSGKTAHLAKLLILCYTQKTELGYTIGKIFLLAY